MMTWLATLGIGGLGAAAIKLYFAFDLRREARRKRAAEAAPKWTARGFIMAPDLLTSYSVGDLSGMGKKAIEMIDLAKDEDALDKEIDRIIEFNVARYARDPKKRPWLLGLIGEAEALEDRANEEVYERVKAKKEAE